MAGNTLKPKVAYVHGVVADGDFITEPMPAGFENTELSYINFYDDAAKTNLVTPSAGTVTVTLSPSGQYGTFRSIPEGVFNANACYDPNRLPPNANGLATVGKVNLAGVTGAAYFTACFWRS